MLTPDVPVGEAVAGAMRNVVEHAKGQAPLARRDPARAVHEWRKSLRRARALLRLTRRALDDHQRSRIGAALRSAQQAASSLRDADALRPVIQELKQEPGLTAADRRALDGLARGLAADRRGGQNDQAASVLAGHVGRIESALGRFERALPATLDWKDLESGLRDSYARARRAYRGLRHGKKAGTDEAFHDLRKAVKALHYQSELLASTGHRQADKARRRLGTLAEAQGRVTDLMVLRGQLEARRDHRDSPNVSASVDRVVDRAISNHRKPALRQARQLLDHPPKRFARKLLPAARRCTSASTWTWTRTYMEVDLDRSNVVAALSVGTRSSRRVPGRRQSMHSKRAK